MKNCLVTSVVLICTMTAATASAQSRMVGLAKRAGIGGSVGGIFTLDDEVNVGLGYGVNFGLAPEPGFGPTIGFGWYSGDLTFQRISGTAEVGQLRVRPLMAGVGYTWVNGPIAASVSINAGVSFNSIRLNDQYKNFFGPGTDVHVDASNSFAARPQFRVEYAVHRKVGIFSSVGYFFTKFNNVIDTPVGRFENEWDGSSFNIFVGAMVYPFR